MKILAWACCALLPAALSGQNAPLYPVAGVVVNSQTGAPVDKARATILRSGSTEDLASMVTGADGRFAFDLPQGVYTLQAGPRGAGERYGVTPGAGFGTGVITGPDKDTSHLIFRWYPPITITGAVLDPYGEPVRSAMIQLLREIMTAGKRTIATVGWLNTDDRGQYTFVGIPAGTYYVAVTGKPWWSKAGFGGGEKVAFIPAYYPAATDPARAEPLVVAPGAEGRADFTLATGPSANVTVKSDARPGQQGCTAELVTEGIGGWPGYQTTQNVWGPVTVIPAIPPGAYKLDFRCSGVPVSGALRPLQVNGVDVTVDIAVRPHPSVSGSIQFKNPDARPRGSLLVTLAREDVIATISASVGPNGAFSFPSVTPERYRVQLRGTDGYFVADIHADGADLRDGVIEVAEGQNATLRIVASDETGRVKGFAVRGDQPVAEVLVALVPAGGAKTGGALGYQTDSDGSFDFQHVPAGDYRLFAVEDLALEYANPAVVRPYLAGALAVRVEAHGVVSQRVPVAAAGK
jgi:hypothetical protein